MPTHLTFGSYMVKRAFWFVATLMVSVADALLGCVHSQDIPAERAFYYWKSAFVLHSFERTSLDTLHVKKLYVKFFDVAWSVEKNAPIPTARINFKDISYKNFLIIPVVFIANEALLHTDSTQIDSLAKNICNELATITSQNHLKNPNEIQFDCDWTAATKNKYFDLLRYARHLRKSFSEEMILSATIRLYQCKYRSVTGVPPVDRGLLMCYNMGNLRNPATNNSILEAKELNKYIGSLKDYPMKLDIALPLFDWKVLFRNGRYSGLIKELPARFLNNIPTISNDDGRYAFLEDTVINGYVFQKGDVLRDEQSDYHEIMRASELITARLKDDHRTVILYHLDSLTLAKYSTDEMENIFSSFH